MFLTTLSSLLIIGVVVVFISILCVKSGGEEREPLNNNNNIISIGTPKKIEPMQAKPFQTERDMYYFDKQKKEWTEVKDYQTSNTIELKELRVVTYNIWFGRRAETAKEYSIRINPLLDIIQNQNPHVICLQECTRNIVKVIQENEYIKENFWISDNLVLQNTLFIYDTDYSNIILTRIPSSPLQLREFPTKLGRKLIYITIPFLNSNNENQLLEENEKLKEVKEIRVGTVHLESYARDLKFRREQLQIACSEFRFSNPDVTSFLMGDFNIADEEESVEVFQFAKEEGGFIDTWSTLHPDDAGITYDSVNNLMTAEMSSQSTARRIDLILYQNSGVFKPQFIQLLGTQPIFQNHDKTYPNLPSIVYPSDHYGVSASFSIEY